MSVSDVAQLASNLISSDVGTILDIDSFRDTPIYLSESYRKIHQDFREGALQDEENVTAAQIYEINGRDFEVRDLGGMIVAKGVLRVRQYRKYPKGGKRAEESQIGADYGIRVSLTKTNYFGRGFEEVYNKGVLIQAKLARRLNHQIILKNIHRAQSQAKDMIKNTRSSYIQIYHPEKSECYYIPAASFASADFPNQTSLNKVLSNVYYDGNQAFYTDLIRSFNGDYLFNPLSDDIFPELKQEVSYGLEFVSTENSIKGAI